MGKRKLNDKQRLAIRDLRHKGVTLTGIAKLYDVSVGTVRMVLNPQLEQKNRENNKLNQRLKRNWKGKEYKTNATSND